MADPEATEQPDEAPVDVQVEDADAPSVTFDTAPDGIATDAPPATAPAATPSTPDGEPDPWGLAKHEAHKAALRADGEDV